MLSLDDYLKKRGITDEQMAEARKETQAYIDAYNDRHDVCHRSRSKQVEPSDDTGDLPARDTSSCKPEQGN